MPRGVRSLPSAPAGATVPAAPTDAAAAAPRAATAATDATAATGAKLEAPASGDAFGGQVHHDPATRDGARRLAEPRARAASAVDAQRLAQAPKGARRPIGAGAPLLPLVPRFSETVRTPAGEVALPAIAGVPVKGHVERFEGVASSLGETAHLTVRAELGRLTEAQFRAVHAALGGRSNTVFEGTRNYLVTDLLPPALQALVNRDLEIPDAIRLKGSKKLGVEMGQMEDFEVGLTMNCHATAWEAMRAYQADKRDVSIFYGEMITMDALAADEHTFRLLGEVKAEKLGDLLALDLQPGDVVQFFEISDWARMTMLLHSAVYVGGGLFFEKPNTEGAEVPDPARYVAQEETPFRLATLDMVAAPISAYVEGRFRAEVRRPIAPLQPAEAAFESSLEDGAIALATKKGRTLGVELVSELEQGIGGGVRAEHMSALVTLPVAELRRG